MSPSKTICTKSGCLAVALVLLAAGLAAGCGSRPATSSADAPAASRQPSAASDDLRAEDEAVTTISDRHGPSWNGRLGETVQVDWYDQASGEQRSERIAVLAVQRIPNPDDDAPNEFGDGVGPYEWTYGIKVRLTGLHAGTTRTPLAYQSLSLSDGSYTADGVAGLNGSRGPHLSEVGRSSVGWLSQRTEQGFTPTEVLMEIGAWRATWSLE